jgi:hypothetical protein
MSNSWGGKRPGSGRHKTIKVPSPSYVWVSVPVPQIMWNKFHEVAKNNIHLVEEADFEKLAGIAMLNGLADYIKQKGQEK